MSDVQTTTRIEKFFREERAGGNGVLVRMWTHDHGDTWSISLEQSKGGFNDGEQRLHFEKRDDFDAWLRAMRRIAELVQPADTKEPTK